MTNVDRISIWEYCRGKISLQMQFQLMRKSYYGS